MNASARTAVRHLGEMVLKVADIQLEAVIGSHFDSKEVVVVLVGFSAGGVLGKKRFGYLLKIVERI